MELMKASLASDSFGEGRNAVHGRDCGWIRTAFGWDLFEIDGQRNMVIGFRGGQVQRPVFTSKHVGCAVLSEFIPASNVHGQ